MKIRTIKFRKTLGGRKIEWDRVLSVKDACLILMLCNQAPIKNGKSAEDVAKTILLRCLLPGNTLTMNNNMGYYSFQPYNL